MSEYKDKSSNEIDLLALFTALWQGILRFFKTIIDAFLFLFVFGIRNLHWMTAIVIIGGIVGYLMFKTSDRIYSSEMIAQPNGFTSVDMAQYINDVHNMCTKNNYLGIASAFDISEEDAGHIRNIEAFHFIDVNGDGLGDHVDYQGKFDFLDSTKVVVLSRILIRAELKNNNKFDEVKEGLLKYIDKNPYLMTVNNIKKRELETLIELTDAEITKLDSLQNFEYFRTIEEGGLNTEGQIIFMNEKVTQLYYRDKISLLDAKLQYEKAYDLATNPITIIKDFTMLEIEDNPVDKYVIKSGFFFGLIGYFILLFIAFRTKIIEFLASKG